MVSNAGEMSWILDDGGGMRGEKRANLLSQRMRAAANGETAQDKSMFTSQKTESVLELRSPPPRKIIPVAVAAICG